MVAICGQTRGQHCFAIWVDHPFGTSGNTIHLTAQADPVATCDAPIQQATFLAIW